MKRTFRSNIGFPHPVLHNDNEDYINALFNIESADDAIIENNEIIIKLKYNLNVNGLIDYINNGNAAVAVCIECVNTEFRHLYRFDKDSQELTIPLRNSLVSEKITVKGYIIADSAIIDFYVEEQNPDFFDKGKFKVYKGDILAISKSYIIDLGDYDPLADRPSIFSIRVNREQQADVITDWQDDDKIIIRINEELFNKYDNLRQDSSVGAVIGALFVSPVLVEVLCYMKFGKFEEEEDIKDKKWYKAIESRLNVEKINLLNEDSMTNVANRIISRLFNSSLDNLSLICKELLEDSIEGDITNEN